LKAYSAGYAVQSNYIRGKGN